MTGFIYITLIVILYGFGCSVCHYDYVKIHRRTVATRRQAIPVAVVQGGTLSKSDSMDVKKSDNITFLCSAAYQNCAPTLIEQAKIDKELHQKKSDHDVTESAYNASVAGAIDNNKTTIFHNNSIYLIKNITDSDEKPLPPTQTVNLLANKELKNPNNTITINTTNYTSSVLNKPFIEVHPLNMSDSSNKISNFERNDTLINKLQTLNSSLITQLNDTKPFVANITSNHTGAITQRKSGIHKLTLNSTESSSHNKTFDKSQQQVTNLTNATSNKRMQLLLPSHIYLHWLVGRIQNLDEEEEEEGDQTSEHSNSILIGPLDVPPDNPYGNGPQDKKTKDLEGSFSVHNKSVHKNSKHKKKVRPKRDVYNLDVVGGKNIPYGELVTRHLNGIGYTSLGGEYEEKSDPTYPPSELAGMYQHSKFPSAMSTRSNIWNKPSNYDIPEQYVPSEKGYDKFIEHEASTVDRETVPRIGKNYDAQIDQGGPVDRASASEAYPENTYFVREKASRISSLYTNPATVTRNSILDNPVVMQLLRQEAETEQGHTRNEILDPNSYDRTGDQQVQNLLSKYDEETSQIQNLYRRMVKELYSRKHPTRSEYAEQDQLDDPDGDLSRENNAEPYYRDQVPNHRSESNYGRGTEENEQSDFERRDAFNMFDNPEHESDDRNDRLGNLEHERRDGNDRLADPDKREMVERYRDYYRGNARQRDDVPEHSYMHRNLVNQFLKMYASQNREPNEQYPARVQLHDQSLNHADLNNENLYPPFLSQPNFNKLDSNSQSSSNSNGVISALASLNPNQNPTLSQSSVAGYVDPYTPTPEQAAIMTNMGTNPENLNYNIPSHQPRDNIAANQQGVVMLMVASPPESSDSISKPSEEERKEKVEHKELTHDGITRTSSNVTDDERDFSVNLKKAADFVLDQAVTEGNISIVQRDEIQKKLNHLLDKQYKNKTRGQIRAQTRAEIPREPGGVCADSRSDCEQFKSGGVCPFMRTFMKGSCSKTCQECPKDELDGITAAKLYDFILRKGAATSNLSASKIIEEVKGETRSTLKPTVLKVLKRIDMKAQRIPNDPVMFLSFENSTRDEMVTDMSGNKNDAWLENGSKISQRNLGTCGKAAELNEGSISWSGNDFKRKPDAAISIAMWVKVKKSGFINWFANGKAGDKTFYAKTKGTAVPAKVWTHVAGTFDSDTGLARIYINGDLEQEQQQKRGERLAKNWLVNGIGASFGDDSLHYVDEVVLYDRSLSNSDIRMLYNRCMFNRMILHFGFQKGNKTNMNDQSGLENNGILIGGAEQKSNCDKCGACLDLSEGPDPTMRIQQVSVKHLPKIKISIGLWVSLNTTKGVHNIFTTESSEGNIGYRLQVVNGRIRWAIGTDTVPVIFDNMTHSEVVPESLWTHLVVTYNNENGLVKMYANGLLKFKDTVPDRRREYLPNNWDNDASVGDKTLKGYIDEFIMYNWELDDSEVLYVRNYCADHPKLVRFTVRVPLTKKTIVPRPNQGKTKKANWWDLYSKIINEKIYRAKKQNTVGHITRANDFTLLKHKKKR